MLLVTNKKNREAAPKNEAGRNKKHFFFTWPNFNLKCARFRQ